MTVIVVTRFLFGGPEIGPVLKRLMKMAESHRAMLLEIYYDPNKIFYLATEYLTVQQHIYEGIIQGGLYLDHKIDYFREGDADVSVKLLNRRISEQGDLDAKFVDLFATYDIIGRNVRLLEYIKGVAYSDLPVILKGRISHPFSYTPEEVNFDIVVDKSFYIDIPPRVILKTNYGSAPESSLGQRVPWAFGSLLAMPNFGYLESNPDVYPPRLGVPAWCIDEPLGRLRSHAHVVKSVQGIWEAREGYMFRCLTEGTSTADADDQAEVQDNVREFFLNGNAHAEVIGTIDHPERLYDKSRSDNATLHDGSEVDIYFPAVGSIGELTGWMQLRYDLVAIDSGTVGVYHIDADDGENFRGNMSVGVGTISLIDENSMKEWRWGEDRIRLKYNGSLEAHVAAVSEIWLENLFITDTRLGLTRQVFIEDYWRRPKGMGLLLDPEAGISVQYEKYKETLGQDWPMCLVSMEGYAEAGVLKDHVVDVIDRIHTQMLDTSKFIIDTNAFTAAKTASESYFGSGYPKVSMPVARIINSEDLVDELCKHYGFTKFILPESTNVWKPKVSIIYHALDISSPSYDETIHMGIVKNLIVRKTDPKDIINDIIVRFDYNFASEKYTDEVYVRYNADIDNWESEPSDSTRETAAESMYDKYGIRSEGFSLDLKHNRQYLPTPSQGRNQAIKALQWYFDFFHELRITVEFDLFVSDIKIGDTIEFDSSVDEDWGKCYGVTWAGIIFRVMGLGFSSEGVHWRHVVAETIPASL